VSEKTGMNPKAMEIIKRTLYRTCCPIQAIDSEAKSLYDALRLPGDYRYRKDEEGNYQLEERVRERRCDFPRRRGLGRRENDIQEGLVPDRRIGEDRRNGN